MPRIDPEPTRRTLRESLNPERFVLFIGYPRSGHSLLGALLNAHPRAMISHELNVLELIQRGVTRERLFRLIRVRDWWFERRGRSWEGYSYQIEQQDPESHQRVLVLGDKKGGGSTGLLGQNMHLLDRLAETVGCPVRILHHVRNPYDNIATLAARGPHPMGTGIEDAARYYASLHAINAAVSLHRGAEVLTTYHEDLISAPSRVLRECFGFLGLDVTADQLDRFAASVNPNPSRSRDRVEWDGNALAQVHDLIENSPGLVRYADDTPGT